MTQPSIFGPEHYLMDRLLDLEKRVEALEVKKARSAKQRKPTDEEWLVDLQSRPCYSHLDVRCEFGKAASWIEATNGRRQLTRAFFITWLNKQPKPMNAVALTQPVKQDSTHTLHQLLERVEKELAELKAQCPSDAFGTIKITPEQRERWTKLAAKKKELKQKLGL